MATGWLVGRVTHDFKWPVSENLSCQPGQVKVPHGPNPSIEVAHSSRGQYGRSPLSFVSSHFLLGCPPPTPTPLAFKWNQAVYIHSDGAFDKSSYFYRELVSNCENHSSARPFRLPITIGCSHSNEVWHVILCFLLAMLLLYQ